jgi:hypothetical protein
MLNLHVDETPAIHKLCPPARLPTSPAPTMIKDIIDKFDSPPIPIVAKIPACGHYVQPPQAQPITRSQLRERTMHMINSAVSKPPAIGYAFAVHQLLLSELTTNHFIGAIIDKEIGAVLEYRHLVNNPATKSMWETSFLDKIGCLF